HDFRIVHLTLAVFLMMHGFQHIVTEAERRDNFVVHGLLSLGDEMAVSSLIWRKKLMDSISGNLGYVYHCLAKSCSCEWCRDGGFRLVCNCALSVYGATATGDAYSSCRRRS